MFSIQSTHYKQLKNQIVHIASKSDSQDTYHSRFITYPRNSPQPPLLGTPGRSYQYHVVRFMILQLTYQVLYRVVRFAIKLQSTHTTINRVCIISCCSIFNQILINLYYYINMTHYVNLCVYHVDHHGTNYDVLPNFDDIS